MLDELLLLSLNLPFLVLLPSYVGSYLFLVESDGTHAIPSCPEMSAPVSLAEVLVALKEFERQFSLEVSHE